MRDLDEMVEEWHDGPDDGIELHEYLGLTWQEYKSWTETTVDPRVACKHCNLRIVKKSSDWYHAAGAHIGKHRCAMEPYGFHAEPVGTPCDDNPVNPCIGSEL